MRKKIAFMVLAGTLLLPGCMAPTIQTVTSNGVQFELIGEVDGNKVYRFQDGSHPHYIATAPKR